MQEVMIQYFIHIVHNLYLILITVLHYVPFWYFSREGDTAVMAA